VLFVLKKTTISLLSVALLTSAVFTAYPTEAASKVKKTKVGIPKKSLAEEEIPNQEFSYEYEGVTFSFPTRVDETQLEDTFDMVSDPTDYLVTETSEGAPSSNLLYKGSVFNKVKSGPTTNVVAPPSGGSQIIDGPYKITYTNRKTREVIAGVSFFVGMKLKIASTVARWLVSGALSKAAFEGSEFLGPTYVGTWKYRAYDNYQNRYRTYSTVVHYKYGNYTSPIAVQSYPMD